MKIVTTSSGPAIEDDDGKIILPNDYAAMSDMIQNNPDITQELLAALGQVVMSMLPVAENYKSVDIDQALLRQMDSGVSAADSIRRIAEAAYATSYITDEHGHP